MSLCCTSDSFQSASFIHIVLVNIICIVIFLVLLCLSERVQPFTPFFMILFHLFRKVQHCMTVGSIFILWSVASYSSAVHYLGGFLFSNDTLSCNRSYDKSSRWSACGAFWRDVKWRSVGPKHFGVFYLRTSLYVLCPSAGGVLVCFLKSYHSHTYGRVW